MNIIDATNLPRAMECQGSPRMPASYPSFDIDPTDRDEGNAAHWLAQQWFNGTIDPNTASGTKAFNGVIITDTMIEHVGTYLKALHTGQMETTTSFGNDYYRVNARCDHWIYEPSRVVGYISAGHGNVLEDIESVLTVDDFKYGRSLIDPEMNWTLIAHAIGLCLFNGFTPQRIVLRIHQPRPYHPDGNLREWSISYEQLMQFYAQIAEVMMNPRDELRTGLGWCRRCHALATCPAARSARMNIMDATTATFSDNLSDDALSYEYDNANSALAMLEAQRDALKELMTHRLMNGAAMQDYGLEDQFANTRWKSGFTPQALSLAAGFDCSKPGLITPAEFKRRGGSEAAYKALTERPPTGKKLVRVSADRRARRLLGK